MNAPLKPQQLRRTAPSKRKRIDVRYLDYEALKRELTAGASSSTEYDAAIRKAAKRAGV